jgi:hypothetical protein
MTLLLWIVRLIVLLLVIRLVLRLVANARLAAREAPRRTPGPERLGGALVRDPQCGTYVPKARAIAAGAGDGALYFCSTECRDAFAAAHHHAGSRLTQTVK